MQRAQRHAPPGLTLRTFLERLKTQLFFQPSLGVQLVVLAISLSASADSAASMPVLIALWVPLMRALTKPASAADQLAPPNDSFGNALQSAFVDGTGAIG